MAPNGNGRTSPVSVMALSPIITVGVRDYDINVTISMFEHHLQDIIDMGDEPAEYLRVCQARLHLIKAGHAHVGVTMIPDVNSGHYLTAEEWFTRYGFAPDMVLRSLEWEEVDDELIDEADRRNIEWLNEEGTETTASITLEDDDTWSFGLQTIDSLDLIEQ